MLRALRIRNLALIDRLDLDFSGLEHGLVVITGETGAGKSIIMQALQLLGGGRGGADLVREGHDSAEIEALFDAGDNNQGLAELLREHGQEPEEGYIVRRVLNVNGRGRYTVNDRLVTARLAGDLVNELVTIAGQHDQQKLLAVRRHLDFLDTVGELWPRRAAFAETFRRWRRLDEEYADLRQREADREQQRDFLAFQVREIGEAAPRIGEDEELAEERERLKAADTLLTLGKKSLRLLEGGVLGELAEARKNMEQAAAIDGAAVPLAERLASLGFELEDAVADLRAYGSELTRDPGRLDEVTARIALLQQLKRKYGGNLESVVDHAVRAGRELEDYDSMDERLARLERELAEARRGLRAEVRVLSTARREAAHKLQGAMERELASLSFVQAAFRVEFGDGGEDGLAHLSADGADQPEFFFSANPGEPPKPLVRIASGGELSRLLLAMKCLLARRDQVDTVIFDEVDAGIGGKAAEAVAAKIRELAAHHQVFCITHLAQIAARADVHHTVSKELADGRTRTRIVAVDHEERVAELARMLAGEAITAQTLAYARELAGAPPAQE